MGLTRCYKTEVFLHLLLIVLVDRYWHLYLVYFHMMRSIFDESVREFCDKFNWFFFNLRGFTIKSDTIHANIQIGGPKMINTS